MTKKLAGYSGNRQKMNEIESFIGTLPPVLQQSFEEAAAGLLSLRYEDEGWSAVGRTQETDGFSLKSIKDIAEYAELQTTGNPLLKRGLTLRTSNVFARGLKIEGTIAPRYDAIIIKPINQRSCFNQEAFSRNERELYNKGNLIMAYRKSTKTFFPIPFKEITNSASNPDLTDDVYYYQRTWTEVDLVTGKPNNEPTVKWYPVLERAEMPGYRDVDVISDVQVDLDVVVVDIKVNTSIGNLWGVPDVLPALGYAWAHAEYIRDASKLLKALSAIAWKVMGRSKAQTQNASTRIANSRGGAQTVAMTDGTDMVSMPRAGQVNMKDGQAIAGYVASALEVSLIALLSDPGSASGSYGAAATLDGPTANAARARQALWVTFYERVIRAIGLKDVEISFPNLQEEAQYRVAQTYQAGFVSGAINQQEYRNAFIELTDVQATTTDLPEPTVFTTAAAYSLEAIKKDEAKQESEASALSVVNGSGQQDGIARSEGNNDLRDQDAVPGAGA